VIRGLAYYTGVVFEAFDRKGEFRAIAGGGRYDQLVQQVSQGAVNLPALGFGMGDVVLAELLKSRGLVPSFAGRVAAVVMIEDESLRGESLRLVQTLREAGHAVDYSLTPAKSDKQFKRALDLGALNTVRLERTVDGGRTARVKNLGTRTESVVAVEAVAALL
jgi:histidyl-tRNA synthetase